MEAWRRWREPLAMILLVVAGVRLLVGVVAVPVLAEAYGSFAAAALFESRRVFDAVLLLVTAGVAASCLLSPATARARVIGTVALIESALAVLATLAYGLMGLGADSSGRGIELAYLLLGLVLPVLAVVTLLALLRVAPALAPQPAVVPPSPAPGGPPPALPAAWQPEQATGRVWTTAGDAARGAPGAGWVGEGEAAGWHPIPGPAEPQRPEQR